MMKGDSTANTSMATTVKINMSTWYRVSCPANFPAWVSTLSSIIRLAAIA
jgi:hypothetical protein